jgi:hypothetical protein
VPRNGHWEAQVDDIAVFEDEDTDVGAVTLKWIPGAVDPPKANPENPPDDEADFPIESDITALFSKDMVPESVESGEAFKLETDGIPVEGIVEYNTASRMATFDPTDSLSYCTTYTATISTVVEDRTAQNPIEEFSWSFTTLPDKKDPNYTWYKDSDGDRHSDGTGKISCDKPGDDFFLAEDLDFTSGDCDDSDASINPAAEEMCDGKDNDCNRETDENLGTVTCGVGACRSTMDVCIDGVPQQCVPGNPTAEICDSIDNNCNGETDENLGSVTCGVGACGRTVDACIDGVPQQCNPGDPVAEVCDGIDNNCNGETDEGLGNVTCGIGACERTVAACIDGVSQQCRPGNPVEEFCDGVDNNCNGETDEGLGTVTCGIGACERTVVACVDGVTQECVPGDPVEEVCDGVDNNCNGETDEGLGTVTCGIGACERTVVACVDGVTQECVPGDPAEEVCDGIDNDCNPDTEDGSEEPWFGEDCDGDDCDLCEEGTFRCVEGEQYCSDTTDDNIEVCDGIDNDCIPETEDGSGEEWYGACCDMYCDNYYGCSDGEQVCEYDPSVVFNFEELTPTYVFGEGPRPGRLLREASTRSGITATIFRQGGVVFDTVDHTSLLPNCPIPGYGSISLDPFADVSASAFIVNFSIPVWSVSVDMGDYNTTSGGPEQDDDVLTLEAYSQASADGELLGSVQVDLPDTPAGSRTWSSRTLYVASDGTCIESIKMIGGSAAGPSSVFYDNITVEPCGLEY